MSKNILLLEDDSLLAKTLDELLRSEGYCVECAQSAEEVLDLTFEGSFDLYIFDINVPDMSGLELLKSLRDADDRTPAIFISALVDLNSIAKAFEVGADDYIKKPFFPEELLIRVNAKLSYKTSNITHNNLEYNQKEKVLKKDGRIFSLGEVQERLFELFIHNKNHVLDQEVLMDCLERPSPTALRVAITKLKQTTGLHIKNLRGVGYVLE